MYIVISIFSSKDYYNNNILVTEEDLPKYRYKRFFGQRKILSRKIKPNKSMYHVCVSVCVYILFATDDKLLFYDC